MSCNLCQCNDVRIISFSNWMWRFYGRLDQQECCLLGCYVVQSCSIHWREQQNVFLDPSLTYSKTLSSIYPKYHVTRYDTIWLVQVKEEMKERIYSLTFNNRQASSGSCCGCRIFFLFPFSLFIPALDSGEERVVIVSRWRDVLSQWISPTRVF
jgi:hypothetical protein